MKTLLSRDEFRSGVFKRDNDKCVICQDPAKDAHHIVERRLWRDEGYYLDNGASLCSKCHIDAESTVISCSEIREKAGITRVILPNHFDNDENYDKWGNVILPNGMRVRGELFDDESVQSILKSGGVLNQFTKYVKFPKIWHLPWSEGFDEKTDRLFTNEDVIDIFGGKHVIVSEKLDGENSSAYTNYLHARSIDGRSHPSRAWLKQFHASFSFDIPEGWRVCGENTFAKHSIIYEDLPSYFFIFAIYNEKNECLDWEETVYWCKLLNLETVPTLYDGIYDEEKIKACFTGKSVFGKSDQEGYVMRLKGNIPWSQHKRSFGKMVRKNHVQTAHNWMNQQVVPNKLKKSLDLDQ